MAYSKLHQAARDYASKGWPVFPLQVGSKIPLANSAGFKDATTDLAQIDAWWAEGDWNIGFEPEQAGLCVVDVDLGGIYTDPECRHVVLTPGNGKHFYYAGSLPPTASKVAPKVDTRGLASYILLPPSCINGIEYVVQT